MPKTENGVNFLQKFPTAIERLELSYISLKYLSLGNNFVCQLLTCKNVKMEKYKSSFSSHSRKSAVFDRDFDFSEHVKITCKSAFFHIRRIAKIRRYLSQVTVETIVHAYLISRWIIVMPYVAVSQSI